MKVGTLAVILFGTASTFAQGQYSSSGLVLEGTIVSATPVVISETPRARYPNVRSYPPPPTTQRLFVTLQLYLRLMNEGTAPLIVLAPAVCWCDKTIEFFEGIPYSVNGETPVVRVLQKTEEWRADVSANADYDLFSTYLENFDRAAPPSASTLLIEPGRYHEFRDAITVDSGYRVEWQAGKTIHDIRTQAVIPEFPAFRVEYKLSVKGRPKHANLFLNLQNRWKSLGHFVIAGDEEILLRSQPIINIPGK